jgi:hypothetical protein
MIIDHAALRDTIEETPMSRPQTLLEISNDIVASAIEILAMSQKLKKREHDEFVRGTQKQRATIATALQLTEEQITDLVFAGGGGGAPGAEATTPKQPELWEYDTKAATTTDLTRRRNLLQHRLEILDYLRSH